MSRRKRHEEHDNHEAWAIPYGDLVTLLLAFFVVMYAMSTVNEGKYRVLSDSLSEAFNGQPRAAAGAADSDPAGNAPASALEMPRTQVRRMIAKSLPGAAVAARGTHPPAPATQPAPIPDAGPASDAETPGSAELGRVADEVTGAVGALVAAGEVHVRRLPNAVVVDISADILFPSGVARLSAGAAAPLQHLADALKPFSNAIRVEGHTDNRPINTTEFPSNWELSAARAASVVHLFMDRGIEPDRLAVIGYGQYRPIGANDSAAGRNANRRVAVVILESSQPGL
jgi:chemotaxis protein MotB